MKEYFALICTILIGLQLSAQEKKFYSKDYGAKADNVTDNKTAFQNCIRDAYAHNGIAVINAGTYKVSKAIYFYLKDNNKMSIEGETDDKGNLPVISVDKLESVFVFESDPNKPAGNVDIKDLEVRGNNVPYSDSHPYFGKHDVYANGVAFFNLRQVAVSNIIVRDVYGEGINVRNWNYEKCPLGNRFTNVSIKDNKVMNCWGANPPTSKGGPSDEYGDGIYVNNATNILIQGNEVINDLSVTRQFGRAGIVIEHNCEGAVIRKNSVSGYDRDIHIEADLGGHVIDNNKLSGSDFSICIYSNMNDGKQQPISIINNYLSNEGIPDISSLIRVRGKDERALISFYAEHDSRKNSVISGNTFHMAPSSSIVGNSFMKIYETGLIVKDNIFDNDTRNKVGIYYDKEPQSVENENYKNVDVYFNKSIKTDFRRANNHFSNSSSNIRF